MAISSEQRETLARNSEKKEAELQGNLFYVGSPDYLRLQREMEKAGITKPQMKKIFVELRTGRHGNSWNAARNAVTQEERDDENPYSR